MTINKKSACFKVLQGLLCVSVCVLLSFPHLKFQDVVYAPPRFFLYAVSLTIARYRRIRKHFIFTGNVTLSSDTDERMMEFSCSRLWDLWYYDVAI